MTIFGKSIDKISSADLAELLADSAVENVRLEFKRDVPAKDETLKKVSSFANTYGGYVVVGAEASSTDGRLTALPGVPPEAGYKQRLIQWAYEGLFPPLTVAVSAGIPTPDDPSRVCYVIEVPESTEAPHFVNGRKGAYVRTDEFSQRFRPELASYAEIQHLANRRQALVNRRTELLRRSHKRFDAYTTLEYKSHPGTVGSLGATAIVSACPVYPAEQLVSQTHLNGIVRELRIDWRQEKYPSVRAPVTQYESVLLLGGAWAFSVVEVTTWGHVFMGVEVEEVRETENPNKPDAVEKTTGIHLYHLVGTLLAHLEYLRQLYEKLEYAGHLLLTVELHRIRGIPFIIFPKNRPKVSPTSPIDEDVTLVLETSTEALSGGRDALVRDLLRSLLFALNWAEEIRDEARVERLLQYGYWYSFWRPPSRSFHRAKPLPNGRCT